MTSNIGTEFLLNLGARRIDTAEWELVKNRVIEELRKHFRPEFLNRVDDV
ncbi:MAG: AAA family ATPase, partial [Rudaea sp.]